MHGLSGHRFASALTVMNGVPDSPINRYHQVEDSVIENNTIIDSAHIELAAGSDAERSAVPITTVFRNNLVYNRDGKDIITVHDDVTGIEFAGNVLNAVEHPVIERGFSSRAVALEELPTGLMRPADPELADVGASADLAVLDRDVTGVDWYPKPDKTTRFDSGEVTRVQPGRDALFDAVAKAGAGDIIELEPGDYRVVKLLEINVPVTLRAADAARKPTVEFERTALFEIKDGGSLKLENLHLSGKSAPDSAGNALVRTSRYSMLQAYQLLVDGCEVSDLDVNHSFNFLAVSKSTLADRIDIRDSVFRNVSGSVLELNLETDDLGMYNAEYVAIVDSTFTGIGEAVADLYRGGTDESTFGPHFELRGSTLDNVGHSKRNRSGAAVRLLGVQRADVIDNVFTGSRPLRVELTVGDPVTVIRSNTFRSTPAPEILNGEALVADNEVVE
jgi:poly(beta-D-mannuronate) lyase